MSKAERFEGLKHLASGREADAARRLADCRSDLDSKEAELIQLRGYLDDYRRETEREDKVLDTARWRNSRAFLSRLNAVVTIREGEFEAAKERYRQEAESWRERYLHTKALEQLVDKYYREDIRDAERRDQKELDEQVLQRKDD